MERGVGLLPQGEEGLHPSRLDEPGFGQGVGLEEGQQLPGDFFAAGVAGVGAVAGQVLAFVDQLVALARGDAVGPEVGAPEEERGLDRPAGGVEIERGITFYLVLDQPADREGAFNLLLNLVF